MQAGRNVYIRKIEDLKPAPSDHQPAKTSGEPLLLPFSVLLTIRDAVSAMRGHHAQPPPAPATSESWWQWRRGFALVAPDAAPSHQIKPRSTISRAQTHWSPRSAMSL